ncbi:MAG: cell division protein FtsZ [Tenericutes bacterium]|nr:MAG: cell division protein FtsZ [Mycoplasmatota bacterium]
MSFEEFKKPVFEEFNTSFAKQSAGKAAKIKIIGIGGAGNNAVNKMIEDKFKGLDFIVANTDVQVLKQSKANIKLILGEETTKGLGAGADPEVGEKSALESISEVEQFVKDTDLVFIAAGMGGGTGTGAAPVIARAAKEAGALVIGIVTTPFAFEGRRRSASAKAGLEELQKHVDSIIVISNDRLLDELGGISLTEAFHYSDAILKQAVRTITDIISNPSMINLDFADVAQVIRNAGPALIGVGKGTGEDSAVLAAIEAINSPILESSIEGAKTAIINVAGSSKSLTIAKAQQAVDTIIQASGSPIDTIFGVTINDDLGDEVVVSIIATGLEEVKERTQQLNAVPKTNSLISDDADISAYKSQETTTEININNIKDSNESTNELFDGLSLLDSDEEETQDQDLKDLFR